MKKIQIIIILSLLSFPLHAQKHQTKKIKASRVQKAPKIDGNASDEIWEPIDVATDFYMFNPGDGDPAPKAYKTEVKLAYDDAALYVLAVMHDPNPENIPIEFALRDKFAQADSFSILINPFLAPGNTYIFTVSSSGTQLDGIQEINRSDMSWNAVWKSAVGFTDNAWIVEMAIPYSALRFKNDAQQEWGITFARNITNRKENYSWTYVDKKKEGDVLQFLGRIEGIHNIQPPVRLSLYPYISLINTNFKEKNTFGYSYGMDLKYGLSEGFTLDATLIPDFSDTPYDNVTLNLGPFEKFYKEKRQFFTEGVQLFNKGDLFYSRRIGNTPSEREKARSALKDHEIVEENPETTPLINAVKISGRMKNGLGIGFLNAITNQAKATLKNTLNGETRKVVTEPFANYNVLVLDYAFKNNSSVSLINTNVIRQGEARDANVTGFVYDLYNHNNTLNLKGNVAMDYINSYGKSEKGYKSEITFSKKHNEHNYGVSVEFMDDKFNINDLGFNRRNNYVEYAVFYNYSILKPTKHFNRINWELYADTEYRFQPYSYADYVVETKFFLTNKKHLSYGLGLKYMGDEYDYNEPRTKGKFFYSPPNTGGWAFISTDYRKHFAVDVSGGYFSSLVNNQRLYEFRLSTRLRASNQLQIRFKGKYSKRNNFRRYVDKLEDNIVFGNRDQFSLTEQVTLTYNFNVKSGIKTSLRHYWSPVKYSEFYTLNSDGTLDDFAYTENEDFNYNIWNLDVGYSWEFAQGSQLSLLYRNNIVTADRDADIHFSDNMINIFKEPKKHSFILKMIYYIDYNTVKSKWF